MPRTTYNVNHHVLPGRMADAVKLAIDAAAMCSRLGATRVDLMRVAAGGGLAGIVSFGATFPSAEACGAFIDGSANDPAGATIRATFEAPDSPVRRISTTISTAIELPSRPPSGEDAEVMYVELYQVKPGRMEDAIANIDASVPAVLSLGVTGLRLQVGTIDGPGSGNLVMVAGFASMAAQGRATDLYAGDAELLAINARQTGPDGPVVPVSTVVLTRIPM
jgi:hypothetical protein